MHNKSNLVLIVLTSGCALSIAWLGVVAQIVCAQDIINRSSQTRQAKSGSLLDSAAPVSSAQQQSENFDSYQYAASLLSRSERNLEAAIYWLKKAAAKGEPLAQYDLGQAYYLGIGVAPNAAKALSYWKLAAQKNLAQAESQLAEAYFRGFGVAKDYQTAANWWRLTAKHGDAIACLHLWQCFLHAQGTEHNAHEAQLYYRDAAHLAISKEFNNFKYEIERIHYFATRQKHGDYLPELLSTQEIHFWDKRKFPLRVFVPAAKDPGGFDEEQHTVIFKCFRKWAKALNVEKLATPVYSLDSADIEFSQEQKNVGDSLGASRSVAEDANTEFSPLRKVRIKLLHDDSIKDDFGSDVWEATCLHEIGHSLGLRHSPYFDDCMYFVNKRKELSASDVASIKHLYAPLTIKAGKDVLQAESAKGNYYAQCKLGTLIISDHANYNEFADALSFWTKSARHGYYEAWDKLAWAHFYGVGVARNFQSAQAECSKAIACQPNYTPPYFNRAQLYCSLQNFKAAIQDCNAALRLEPRNPVAYNNRAAANEIANDYSSAISDYTEAIRLAPEFALSYRNRAQAYAQMFMFDNAIEDQTKAIALLLANQADAYCSLGKYFLLKKAVGEAQLNFKKAAATADSISGFAPRSEAKLRLGLYTEALSDANRAVRAEPWESNAYCRRGEALMALGKIKEALHDFDAALAIEIKNHGEAFYLRAQAYKALGDNKKAQVDEANANRCGYHALPPLIKLK